MAIDEIDDLAHNGGKIEVLRCEDLGNTFGFQRFGIIRRDDPAHDHWKIT